MGSGFEVNGVAVPFGPISTASGTLTGMLLSGDMIDSDFFITDPTAQIVLVPETSTGFFLATGLAALAWRVRA